MCLGTVKLFMPKCLAKRWFKHYEMIDNHLLEEEEDITQICSFGSGLTLTFTVEIGKNVVNI